MDEEIAIEHYVVLNGAPTSYATWMGLEDIMLSKDRQTDRQKGS